MKKGCLVLGFLFCLLLPARPQSTNISTLFHKTDKKGDYLFDHFAYRNALEVYLQAANNSPDDVRVRQRIGQCYVRLRDPASAEQWYSSIAGKPGTSSSATLEYAEVLTMNGKYGEAIHWLGEYLKQNPKDQLAADKLRFLKRVMVSEDNERRFLIGTFDHNSRHGDFGANYFHNGVVFSSTRDRDFLIKRKPLDGPAGDESFLNLYYSETPVAGEGGEIIPFAIHGAGTHYHEGPVTFYDRYRKAAFTRSNLKNGRLVYDAEGKVNLGIYFARANASGQLHFTGAFEYNSDSVSNAHPSLTRDGSVMFFSSSAPGGYGGSDLYYCEFKGGRWGKPVNLGEHVNTREDESFPFIANDTTLYFSSDGHGSYGGIDLYVTYRRDGRFGRPINLGSPMNSRFDDFALVCDSLGRSGYIASNREGGIGEDDIYVYVAGFYFLAGRATELGDSKHTLAGVKIVAFNSNGDLIDSARSDANGNFTLDLPFDQDFRIRGELDGFETLTDVPFSTRGKPFGIDSLTLPMWRQNLFAKGRLFSNETQSILPGVTVVLNNLSDGSSDTLLVDDTGQYQFLVRPDTKYRIEATHEGYIPNGFNLDTRGMRSGELLNDIVLEEIYIDKQVILFEYDEHELTGESVPMLSEILRTLRRYSHATLNVGAHADARGSTEYNDGLSRKRALSTQRYFLDRGISASRIHLSWFGEELVLNRCSDGVECPEEEHSLNRRAELKVQLEP